MKTGIIREDISIQEWFRRGLGAIDIERIGRREKIDGAIPLPFYRDIIDMRYDHRQISKFVKLGQFGRVSGNHLTSRRCCFIIGHLSKTDEFDVCFSTGSTERIPVNDFEQGHMTWNLIEQT